MKFNLGDKVRIKSNGVIGIIIARGYNEYLNENDKQQSFEEYQIEADKYYQCNEDEIELVTIGQVLQSIYDIPPQIKIKERKCCGNCCSIVIVVAVHSGYFFHDVRLHGNITGCTP